MFEEYNDIMTTTDLQSALGIGRSLAYRLIHSGKIKHIKVGSKIKIPKTYLLDYIDKSCYNSANVMNGDLSCREKEDNNK